MPRPPVIAALLLWLALAAGSLYIDIGMTAQGGAIDLRNRVTGFRLLAAGRDAFHYKWQASDPAEFCDPYNNAAATVSKTTVTPAMLLLHQPVAALDYAHGRFLWLGAQWLAILALAAAGWHILPAGTLRWVWAFAVLGFSYGASWRLHAERGQSYIVLAALLAWWAALSAPPARRQIADHAAGLLAGLLVALRPPLLLLLPFLVWKRKAQLPGFCLGLLLAVGIPMLLHPPCWSEYSAGMQTWSEHYRHGVNPRPPALAFPATVEGLPIDVLGHFARIPFADTSIFAATRMFTSQPLPAAPVLLPVLALGAAWFWRARRLPDDVLLGGLCVWMFLCDFFLPALRNTYNDALVFPALLAALHCLPRTSATSSSSSLLAIPRARLWLAAGLLPPLVSGAWVMTAAPKAKPLLALPTLLWAGLAVCWLVLALRRTPLTCSTDTPTAPTPPCPPRRATRKSCR